MTETHKSHENCQTMKLHRKQNREISLDEAKSLKRVDRACGRKITESMENAAKDFKQKMLCERSGTTEQYTQRQLWRLMPHNIHT